MTEEREHQLAYATRQHKHYRLHTLMRQYEHYCLRALLAHLDSQIALAEGCTEKAKDRADVFRRYIEHMAECNDTIDTLRRRAELPTDRQGGGDAPAVIDRATSTEAEVQAAIRDAVVSGRGLTIAENGITRMQIAARRPVQDYDDPGSNDAPSEPDWLTSIESHCATCARCQAYRKMADDEARCIPRLMQIGAQDSAKEAGK